MTLCNVSIEAEERAGMVAPNETIFDYLKGKPYAPKGTGRDRAVAYWRTLPSDGGAVFDREATLDGSGIAPNLQQPDHSLVGLVEREGEPV